MARIRTIKPEFFTSLTIAGLTVEQRLTFIGLWTHVDDEGRCIDDARLVKAALWPLDDRLAADIEDDLRALAGAGLIVRYAAMNPHGGLTEGSVKPHGGLTRTSRAPHADLTPRRYLAVLGWREHQKINRPSKSRYPGPDQAIETVEPRPDQPLSQAEPPLRESSLNAHGGLTEDSSTAHDRNREQGAGSTHYVRAAGSTGVVPITDASGEGASAPHADPASKIDLTVRPANSENDLASDRSLGTDGLLAGWLGSVPKRPPEVVISKTGKQVKAMLAEGIDPGDIGRGLSAWAEKGLDPAALPSVVNEVMNGSATKSRHQKEVDAWHEQGMARARMLDEMEANQ